MKAEELSNYSCEAIDPNQSSSRSSGFEALLTLLNSVALRCREPGTIEDIVDDCLGAVRDYTDWPLAHAYRRNESARVIAVSTRRWHFEPGLDSRPLANFIELSEKTEFAENQGLVGRVLAGDGALTLADVGIAPGFVRAPAAVENGLRGCFVFPVLASGKVEYIFEFFSREAAVLNKDLLELMRFVGDAIGHAAERNKLIQDFNDNVRGVVEQMNQAVAQIGVAVDELGGSVAETQARCQHATESIALALDDTRGIVKAAHAMAGSAQGVLERSERSLKQTREAKELSEQVEQQVLNFARSSEEIDSIRARITDVTRKTKILALNASIEAARAGEAGLGFNVVAREVKGLTSETTVATDRVGALVDNIGQSAARAIASMEQIATVIGDSETLSSAVAEEMAAQTEIAQNIDHLISHNAEASALVQEEIGELTQTSQKSGGAAKDAGQAVGCLSAESEQLAQAVAVFMAQLSGET